MLPRPSVDEMRFEPRLQRLRLTRKIVARCKRLPDLWRGSVRRGDIYRLRPAGRSGHEQQGRRFGVVVRANALLPRSVVLVALTSRSARPASFRPEVIIDGEVTKVLVEQVGAVDINRLGDHVGVAAAEEMWGIDESLVTVLGLR